MELRLQSGSTEAGGGRDRGHRGGPLRVGLLLRSNRKWLGGVHYVLYWLQALRALPEEERPEIYLLYTAGFGEEQARERAPWVHGIAPRRQAEDLALDFVYPAKEVFEAPIGVPWGGWIVDWQQHHLPEMFTGEEQRQRELRYRHLAGSAPVVALSSRTALEDTARLLGNQPAPLHVLPFRAVLDPEELRRAAPEAEPALPPRYLLVCNQWFRHKNHAVVLQALALLRARGIRVPCVFTGETADHRWPRHFPEMLELRKREGLESSTFILGSIPRDRQIRLLRGALAVVQPSLFEGWSTIVEEARALGKTLLLSDIPVHLEQAPPGSEFFPPANFELLAELLRKTWEGGPASGFDSAREASALHDQRRLIVAGARQFLRAANEARRRFNPIAHDPRRGAIELVREVIGRQKNPDHDSTLRFVHMGCRGLLARQPERLAQFVAMSANLGPAGFRFVVGEVVPRVLFHAEGIREACRGLAHLAAREPAVLPRLLLSIVPAVRRCRKLLEAAPGDGAPR